MTGHAKIVQALLDLFEHPRYLEIGVFEGATFTAVRSALKTGVDPTFRFDWRAESEAPEVTLVQSTSDKFFASLEHRQRFDVVYVDGLHDYEQVLRDVLSALTHLGDGGIIVISDVLPTSYAASLPAAESHLAKSHHHDDDPAWMGDAYKVAFFIDAFLPQFSFATAAETSQLVCWYEPRDVVERDAAWPSGRTYIDTIRYRDMYNLMKAGEIIDHIRSKRTYA